MKSTAMIELEAESSVNGETRVRPPQLGKQLDQKVVVGRDMAQSLLPLRWAEVFLEEVEGQGGRTL